MIIRAGIKDVENVFSIGIVDFLCKSIYDFKFAITSDPRIKVFYFYEISWGEIGQGGIALIDADEYRQENEHCQHEGLDLLSLCEEVGIE